MFRTPRISTICLAGAAALAASSVVQAATLAGYEFSNTLAVTVEDPNVDATDVSTTGFSNGGYSTNSAMNGTSIYLFSEFAPASTTTGSYYEFSVTAGTGYKLNLDELSLLLGVTDSTNNSTPFGSNIQISSDVEGFGTFLDFVESSNDTAALSINKTVSSPSPTNASTFSIDLSGAAYQDLTSITFRVFPSVTIAVKDEGVFRLDSVVLSGESVVPEPASMALMGVGGLMLLSRRRSH